MKTKWFKAEAIDSNITTSEIGDREMESTLTEKSQDSNVTSTTEIDPFSKYIDAKISVEDPFWNILINTLQSVILSLLSKLNSWSLIIWFLIFYARIQHGESWNLIMVCATVAILCSRVAFDYLNKKYQDDDFSSED